jgi:hypothetical protein
MRTTSVELLAGCLAGPVLVLIQAELRSRRRARHRVGLEEPRTRVESPFLP